MSERYPTNSVEIWKPIPDYEGLYEISNYGRVKGLVHNDPAQRGVIKNPHPAPGKRYLRVALSRHSVKRTLSIHRLVALVFIGSPPDETRTQVNHIDGDALNNRADNLEWVSSSENMWHASRSGLLARGDRNGSRLRPERLKRGSENSNAKLNEEQVRQIRQMLNSGQSCRSIGTLFHVPRRLIERIRRRETWAHI